MLTRTSISSATLSGSRLVLAGLVAFGGCLANSMNVAADDSATPPSFVTFRQLFEHDAKGANQVDGSTQLESVDDTAEAATSPSLVTFLQVDPNPKTLGSGSNADSKNRDASRANGNGTARELKPVEPEGDRLGGDSIFGGDAKRSPSVQGGRFVLPPFMTATTETSEIGNGRTPDGFREGADQILALLPESGLERGVDWDWSVRTWAAPNTFSHPRYFEDRMLERHGHERFPCLQPLASGARFFATVPMLPYLMAVRPPCECEYTLGYYRSGSCAPNLKQRPPYERKAVVAEAAAVAGTVLILP